MRRLRGLFRFRLKTLLGLMVIAGIGFGWWSDRNRLATELAKYKPQRIRAHWEAEQSLGPPNTAGAGDIVTAWASATPDGQKEWLELTYPRAVRPKEILIHETYNPGALYKVEAYDLSGDKHTVWTGKDPTSRSKPRGISVIPLNLSFRTKRIVIHLDSPAVPGWNEIDAVGMRHGYFNRVMWASGVKASTVYGQTMFMSGQPVINSGILPQPLQSMIDPFGN